ncbi:helix-turn-helix protein [Stackebrandtia endophytica]|uniref:Helix-turn-helix protein n=1 Tax=Stackebrandtia endophytica TaxID=1496996 RepID=A0A543AR79_9ACTN|nr:helix-turn-helix transcriptional regulator [Stackebrandtia endophytica]TQL75036.1 helix-turn-helix protein [Stackebrandtia endophytica]
MDSWRDPGAQRWLLGGEVASIRESAHMSLAELAAVTEISKPKLGQLERGTYNVSPDELERILLACRASDADIARLTGYATRPRGRPWWNPWASIVPDWFGLFLGLEGMAVSISAYEPSAVPGLLQTADYARAITSVGTMVRPADIERHVELRVQRGRRLTEQAGSTYDVVIEEAVLHRMPSDRTIMRDQLQAILDLTDLDNIRVRILPLRRELHAAMTAPQHVLFGFADMDSVAYAEVFGGARYSRSADTLRSYREAGQHLSAAALSDEATRDFLRTLRRET